MRNIVNITRCPCSVCNETIDYDEQDIVCVMCYNKLANKKKSQNKEKNGK
jgi:hypothetical protein